VCLLSNILDRGELFEGETQRKIQAHNDLLAHRAGDMLLMKVRIRHLLERKPPRGSYLSQCLANCMKRSLDIFKSDAQESYTSLLRQGIFVDEPVEITKLYGEVCQALDMLR